jgi:hypothetical protein
MLTRFPQREVRANAHVAELRAILAEYGHVMIAQSSYCLQVGTQS